MISIGGVPVFKRRCRPLNILRVRADLHSAAECYDVEAARSEERRRVRTVKDGISEGKEQQAVSFAIGSTNEITP